MSEWPDFGARIDLDDGVTVRDWMEARDIARLYMGPEQGDAARWEHDARRIRAAIALKSYSNHMIEMSCWNNTERDEIERRLTVAERSRVQWRVTHDWPPRAPSPTPCPGGETKK